MELKSQINFIDLKCYLYSICVFQVKKDLHKLLHGEDECIMAEKRSKYLKFDFQLFSTLVTKNSNMINSHAASHHTVYSILTVHHLMIPQFREIAVMNLCIVHYRCVRHDQWLLHLFVNKLFSGVFVSSIFIKFHS